MYKSIKLNRHWNAALYVCRRAASSNLPGAPPETSSVSAVGIAPPPRIHRGSTDLLLALATTVQRDPTAAHYKYHDDPFLIPRSNQQKRSLALAQEAGRKAAVWIRDQHAPLFTQRSWDPPNAKITAHRNADPEIPAFAPKMVITDDTKVTESDLDNLISAVLVEDAIKAYALLRGAAGVLESTRKRLLQLVAFHNQLEADSELWMEERWFMQGATRGRPIASWKNGGLAEDLFNSLETKDSAAYCVLIQGMCKFYQAERAYELSRQALETGVPLSTAAYNALLRVAGFLKEGFELRQQLLLDLLAEMNQYKLSPDSGTLSSCLRSVAAWGGGRAQRQLASQLMAEMTRCGVQRTLAVYYHLLCVYCKEHGPRSDILYAIVGELEKQERLEATHSTDVNFFVTAMAVCNEHLQDLELAERVHALLLRGDNYRLLGDAYKESIYYRHLVTLACRCGTLQRALHYMDTLVPNVYVPEPSVMDEIVTSLELGSAGDRLAKLWSQIVIFGQSRRVNLVEKLLAAMCSCYESQEPEVKEQMRNAAADIWRQSQVTEEVMRSPPPQLSAVAHGHIIQLCASTDALDDSWIAARECVAALHAGKAAGVPASAACLVTFAERALIVGEPSSAALAVTYLSDCGFEEATLAASTVLQRLLNRTDEEVSQLASKSVMELKENVDETVLQLLAAFNQSSPSSKSSRSVSTSSSATDSSTSDSDNENKKDNRQG